MESRSGQPNTPERWSQLHDGVESVPGTLEPAGTGKKSSEKRQASHESHDERMQEGLIWLRATQEQVRERTEHDTHSNNKKKKEKAKREALQEEIAESHAQVPAARQAESAPKPVELSSEDERLALQNQAAVQAETAEQPHMARAERPYPQWQQQPELQAMARDGQSGEDEDRERDQPAQESQESDGKAPETQSGNDGNLPPDGPERGSGQSADDEPEPEDYLLEEDADIVEPGEEPYGPGYYGAQETPGQSVDYEAGWLSPFQQSETAPPMPPNPSEYRRSFWREAPAEEGPEQRTMLPPVYAHEQQQYDAYGSQPTGAAYETYRDPNMPDATGMYQSNLHPGLQRSPADVSRAGWSGLLFGWALGRRGKRKAVEQAHLAGYRQAERDNRRQQQPENHVPAQSLEAVPLHTYPQQETSRVSIQPISATEVSRSGSASGNVAANPIFAAEAMPADIVREAAKTPEAPLPAPGSRSEHALDRKEAIRLAKVIKIDGIRLKDIFNAKRIDEAGLFAVVETYLRGGDVKKQLAHEVVNKEKSFERDPLNRQRSSGQVAAAISKASDIAKEQGAKLAGLSQGGAKKAGEALSDGTKQAQKKIINDSDSSAWLAITLIVIIYSAIAFLVFG